MPGIHVFRQRILDAFNYLQFVEFERRRALFVQVPILFRDRLMTLGEPIARRDERPDSAFAAAARRFAFGATQNGHVEAVRS